METTSNLIIEDKINRFYEKLKVDNRLVYFNKTSFEIKENKDPYKPEKPNIELNRLIIENNPKNYKFDPINDKAFFSKLLDLSI